MEEKETGNDRLWNQFAKLGEMMGDGLHHESDGKWITKEYNKLAKILIPELKEKSKERRKIKSQRINEQMINLLAIKKCMCGGSLSQSRSGSKICYCTICNKRYQASSNKKPKTT